MLLGFRHRVPGRYTTLVKVAIDIRRIGDFGVGTYIRNVVRTLGRLDHENEYVLIGVPERVPEMGPLPDNFSRVNCPSNDYSPKSYFEFYSTLRRHRPNVLHIPHLFWIPQGISCPYVVTVHDLLDYLYRTGIPSPTPLKRMLHFYLTGRALRRSARIFAVSKFSKADTVRLFGVPDQKIDVIYNAIDERFRQGHATEAERQAVAERYQVHYPFVLYAGRISPHKNVVRIIEAFSLLKSELQKDDRYAEYQDLKLIIIGDEVSRHPDLRRAVIKGRVQHEVRFLGFVPIDVLRVFYDVAKVFIFPSLYEGFGLPPLEAMAHGTPVITSNTASLPEVVDGGAVMVNPENVFEIMRALQRVLLDSALRERLKARGLEQCERFSWDTSVGQMLEVFQRVAK